MIVENRPGASATIAATAVARSAPDGYVLSMGQLTPNAIAPALAARLQYDAIKDFAPIALVGTSPNILVVYPGLPVRTLAELTAHAKAQTKSLTYASSGSGSLQHVELIHAVQGQRPGGDRPDGRPGRHELRLDPRHHPAHPLRQAARDRGHRSERFAGLSVEPGGGSRAEFAGYVRAEIAKYERIVKQLGIKGE